MIEELKRHIELLFEDAPKTRAAYELKEELMANSIERYNDLTEAGMEPEAAYQNVIGSMGNVSELFADLEQPQLAEEDWGRWRRKSALITAVAVGLYIVAGMVMFAGGLFYEPEWAFIIALGICIVPTCMLVYRGIAYPNYQKREETVVEDFKKFSHAAPKARAVRSAVSSILWTLILVIYFVVSFLTGAWYITWVLFLVGGCLEGVLTLFFSLKELK